MPQPSKTHRFVLLICGFVRGRVCAHDLRFAVVLAATLLASSLFTPLARGQYCRPENAGGKPSFDRLQAVAQAGISGAIGRDQATYHATAGQNSARMETPERTLRADFSSKRVDFQVGAYVWRMKFAGYGYGDKLLGRESVPPKVEANRVEYRRGILTEWYVNGPLGLEQGLTLTGAPGQSKGKPLTFAFDLSGDLKPEATPDRRTLTLENHKRPVLRYGGLMAMDASGRELNTWLEVESNHLRLRVDDAGARYPIVIDPIVQPATVELVACDGRTFDQLGFSVAVSADGNTVVASANVALAAYVFLKPQSVEDRGWASITLPIEAVAKLVSSDGTAFDFFGVSTSMSGDGSTIVIGASSAAGNNGEAYVFEEPASGWNSSVPLTETARLTASDGAFGDFFGDSVSVSGDGNTVVVGAAEAKFGANANQGKTYVFAKPTTGWITSTESAVLTASDGAAGDEFGTAVGADDTGSTVVVGAWRASGAQGAAWVFTEPTNGWASSSAITETAKLTASDAAENEQFGISVQPSGDGNTIVVGAWWATVNSNVEEGAAYVFRKPPGGWTTSTETGKLTASDGVADMFLGTSVGINHDGTTIVAGAPPPFGSTPGAVYVFAKPVVGWKNSTETMKLAPSNGAAADEVGYSVGINGNGTVIAVGAPDVTPGTNKDQGALYIFTGTFRPAGIPSVNLINLTAYVGSTSSSQSVSLTNDGTVPLDISGVAATGPFITTQNCVAASPLAAGASCTENVTFIASGVGSFTGMLTFTDDAGEVNGSKQQVTLNGAATQASPTASITSFSPDPALVGQAVTFSFSVSPPIGDALIPSGTVTVKASTGESCTGTAPSGSCSIGFSTAVTRTVSATYGGDTNFISSTSSNVSERVIDFSLSASPSSETVPERLAIYTLTAESINGFAGAVSLACGPLPAHTSCAVFPGSLSLPSGSSRTALVVINAKKGTYTLTFMGMYEGSMRTATARLVVK